MSGGRALGIGLLVGAGVVTLLMLLWLAVSGASSGGIVLGLLLLAVLAGPLAGAGWYVLARQPSEEREAAQFASERRVLESDRAFRHEIGVALRELAEQPAAPRERLLGLARSVESADDQIVRLDDAAIDTLRRYDDLVWQTVRHMRDSADWDLADLQRTLDQRQDLLERGRLAPGVPATDLLKTGVARSNVADVALGDAVSRDAYDYVVETLASYFSDGATWKLAHLVPTSGPAGARWLYVAPGGTEAALLDEIAPTESDALDFEGESLPQVSAGSAVVDVTGGAGSAQGVLVGYRRFAAGPLRGLVERWPDNQLRAYAGRTIGPIDLEVWPAARAS
jgi:hypothetical protein